MRVVVMEMAIIQQGQQTPETVEAAEATEMITEESVEVVS